MGFSVGVLTLAMRSNSYIDFFFNPPRQHSLQLPLKVIFWQLDEIRRQMLADLGLACNHVQQGGMGDTEFYLRWFDRYDYCFKLRSLDYGFRFGALIPTGVKRKIYLNRLLCLLVGMVIGDFMAVPMQNLK